ncbi:MAG: Rne/Rng family ribonuclease [Candidatus Shikimatogenerans bostrichidophilus]|nr:MAG: Rne/Rng family ribonuclease [Candidatus Shikimatogenerans bostrichidophilus]
MIKELIINVKKKNILIALLENKKLVELYKKEIINKNISVGDIFIGKVIYISKGMNAVFVDIGYKKYGFLHFDDLGEKILKLLLLFNKKKIIKKKYKKINDYLFLGDYIILQVIKEPIKKKGPKMTCKISLVGRYIILIPFYKKIFFSKKIKNKKKIKYIKKNIKIPKHYGCIIRTLSQYKSIKKIQKDIYILLNKWKSIFKKKRRKIKKIFNEKNFYYCLLRDNLDNNYKNIICNNYKIYNELLSYLYIIDKKKINIIKNYNNNIPIFDKFGIEKQIKILLGKYVSLKDGSYLIIENTEALHVIDINSNMKKNNNINNSALQVNLIAIKEIARQIRLRNMGGIIIIDCIDMIKKSQKKKVYDSLKKEMKNDRFKHKILPPSKFNLIQITRERIREETNINNKEPNPNNNLDNCSYVESPFYHIKKIEHFLNFYYKNNNDKIFLHVHPFIAAYLKYGFFSLRLKWFIKYKKWINIIERNSFNYLEYKFLNDKNKCLFVFNN